MRGTPLRTSLILDPNAIQLHSDREPERGWNLPTDEFSSVTHARIPTAIGMHPWLSTVIRTVDFLFVAYNATVQLGLPELRAPKFRFSHRSPGSLHLGTPLPTASTLPSAKILPRTRLIHV